MNPLSAVLEVGTKLIDRLWPDPAQKAAATMELMKLQQSGDLAAIAGQLEINKAEAANPNLFVAGWRPFVGWVCGGGFAIQFVAGPLLTWGSTLMGHPVAFPQMDMSVLMTMLAGMLGMGGLRTYEKLNNAEKNR